MKDLDSFEDSSRAEKFEICGQNMSQISFGRCCSVVDALSEAIVEMKPNEAWLDIETIFHAQYERIARVIARVIRDPACAEELAVEVFLKWSRNRKAQGENAEGWLYRTAVRIALNELRRQMRQNRYERLFALVRGSPTPEELLVAREEQEKVRQLLSALDPRQAELLVLRSHGLSYEELASTLNLNPASIGTFLSRAQQAFRKEYVQRYGEARYGKE
jgi:RNA polymerase sigma-70 factor, ECF subfamily